MKKIFFASILLAIALIAKVETQSTASYGFLVTSLSTTSAGAVTGTSYGVPQGSASIITWTITEDGGAQSTFLEGSNDNTTWFTIDTNTDALGGIRNYGFTSIKFVRVSQTSRTGGTNTVGTILTSRAFPSTGGSVLTPLSSNLLFNPDATYDIGASGATRPRDIYASRDVIIGGNFNATSGSATIASAGGYVWNGRGRATASSNGIFGLETSGGTIGVTLKVDSLPTINSGFGTAPSILAGSTPYAGAVDVGTGAAATTGTIDFNGVAFPSRPFCNVTTTLLSGTRTVVAPTTTTLVITATVAWPANDIIQWICISPKS